MILTYQEIMDAGAWDRFCEEYPVNPYAVKEGGGDCQASLTSQQAHHLGIIRMEAWKVKPIEEVYPPKEKYGETED